MFLADMVAEVYVPREQVKPKSISEEADEIFNELVMHFKTRSQNGYTYAIWRCYVCHGRYGEIDRLVRDKLRKENFYVKFRSRHVGYDFYNVSWSHCVK